MSVHDTLVHHLTAVHRALGRLVVNARATAVDGSVSHRDFLTGLACTVTAIRAHHLYEDEVLLPLVRRRGAEGPWGEVTTEHEALARDLATLVDAVARADRDAALDPLTSVCALLPGHMAREEAHLTVDVWRDLLTEDEARAFGKETAQHSRAHNAPAARVLPLLLYNLDDDERARFTERMPSFVVHGLVPWAFRPRWRRLRSFMSYPPRRLLSGG